MNEETREAIVAYRMLALHFTKTEKLSIKLNKFYIEQ